MNTLFDRLNLRPNERRILVGVLTIILLVLNGLFVWPHFKDWPRVQSGLAKARTNLDDYQAEAARLPEYEAKLAKLEGQGSAVLPAEQALQLQRTVQNQAQQSKVPITYTRPVATTSASGTNAFFDEQGIIIGVTTGDKELVDFLVALGAGNSMIRVRDMDLRPDPSQFKLNGNVTLVASYQRKPKTTPAPSTAPAAKSVPKISTPIRKKT